MSTIGELLIKSKGQPIEILMKVQTTKGECFIKNVWDPGDGTMDSCHNEAGMIVENIPSGRRYLCNEGQPDEDFNDIIFRIELLK